MAALNAPAEYFVESSFFIFVNFYFCICLYNFIIISLTALQMYIRFVLRSYPLINKRFGTVFAQVALALNLHLQIHD